MHCWEHALADETTFLKTIFDKLEACSKEWELKVHNLDPTKRVGIQDCFQYVR